MNDKKYPETRLLVCIVLLGMLFMPVTCDLSVHTAGLGMAMLHAAETAADVPASPAVIKEGDPELEKEATLLEREREALEIEYKEIVAERNRLADEKEKAGSYSENIEFNDAVALLKLRIQSYQDRKESYKRNVKAYNEKVKALESQQ